MRRIGLVISAYQCHFGFIKAIQFTRLAGWDCFSGLGWKMWALFSRFSYFSYVLLLAHIVMNLWIRGRFCTCFEHFQMAGLHSILLFLDAYKIYLFRSDYCVVTTQFD